MKALEIIIIVILSLYLIAGIIWLLAMVTKGLVWILQRTTRWIEERRARREENKNGE